MSARRTKRIGLVGFGTIGREIAGAASERRFAEIDFVCTRTPVDPATVPDTAVALTDVAVATARDVDVVVEAAAPAVVRDIALAVLDRADLVVFSLTSLADNAFRQAVTEAASRAGTRLYVPHGAVLALDGLCDGRGLIDEVTVTTVKHPRSLGLADGGSGVLFDGTARDACARFPRNVNVHAAVALAGIGFDRTHSRIVADATSDQMRHEITVRGQGLAWDIRVESRSLGGVTGSYTPASGAGSVERAVVDGGGIAII